MSTSSLNIDFRLDRIVELNESSSSDLWLTSEETSVAPGNVLYMIKVTKLGCVQSSGSDRLLVE